MYVQSLIGGYNYKVYIRMISMEYVEQSYIKQQY